PLSNGLKAIFNDLAGGVSFAEVATKTRVGKSVNQSTNPLLADAEARAQR
ncbi:peptidase, partial [Pseudomonas gessardii]|nr:peptidase [Pseudomonas gessardii]